MARDGLRAPDRPYGGSRQRLSAPAESHEHHRQTEGSCRRMTPRPSSPRRVRRRESPARRNSRGAITTAQRRELVRNRLIDSRLTPNAISLTGLALNILAAVLVWERLFFLGGIAFIIGSIMDTLDGRYSRMSGKGTPFGAFLDSTLDRIEEGIVLTAVAGYFALQGDRA